MKKILVFILFYFFLVNVHASGLKFEKIVKGLSDPWSLSFIDNESILFTEKSGKLYTLNLKNKKISEINHNLNVREYGQGGLLDVLYKDQSVYIKIENLLNHIQKNKWTISANGTFFATNKQSVLSTILTKWFNERVYYKGEMKKAYKAGNKEEGDLNHLRQYTMKILLNSLYGATALPTFRYGSVLLSEGITLTGQRIIQDSGTFINKTAEEQPTGT